MFLLNSLAAISTVVYEAQAPSFFDTCEFIANLLSIVTVVWGFSKWIYDTISGKGSNGRFSSNQIFIFFIMLSILFFAAGRAMSCSGPAMNSCGSRNVIVDPVEPEDIEDESDTPYDEDETDDSISPYDDEINPFENISEGDYIEFGSYYGSRSNRKEPISWRVLDVDRSAGRALLITEYGIDAHVFHNHKGSIPWKDSSLRRWLNNSFYDSAFSSAEKDYILYSEIETRNYNGGYYYTDDYVFCLSDTEVETYFSGDMDREALPTNHAVNNGAEVGKTSGNCCWWLRTPGDSGRADSVHFFGFIMLGGNPVDYTSRAVRPAIYVSI